MNNIAAVIWGIEGSGKTSIGLSFPKNLFHMEFDIGGFERAIWRFERKKMRVLRLDEDTSIKNIKWEDFDIVNKPYVVPVQIEKLMGAAKEGVSVRFPRQIVGYKELWQRFLLDYIAACKHPAVKSIQIDATTLWSVCHQSLLQEKQEVQLAANMKVSDKMFREKLLPVEYPNDRMKSVINTAKGCRKNLILIHYPRNIYKQKFDAKGELVDYKSDDLEPDGFKQTAQLADIIIWAYAETTKVKGVQNVEARARITIKCGIPGLGMKAVGLELPEPTYQGLELLQKAMIGDDNEDD